MSATSRVVAAGYLLALLALSLVGQLFSLHDLRAIGLSLFLLTGWGIAPCLLVGTMSMSSFVLASGALSISATTAVGFLMARLNMWHPATALVFAIISALVMLAFAVAGDIKSLGRPTERVGALATRFKWIGLSLVGSALIVVDSLLHRGDPTVGGLLTRVGPVWFVGAAVLILTAILAWNAGSSPALPLLVLSAVVVGSQAIMYGAPTVMSAGKHVGVLEFIQSHGLAAHTTDIYLAWPGLFSAGAWTTAAAGIADPMTLATWFPVVLSVYTALAVRHLAGRFLPSAGQAWLAATIATLAGSVNIVYFSPQSVGFTLCLIITATLISSNEAVSRAWLRYSFAAGLTCVVTITHEISPYLMAAEFVALVVFRLVRPWWLPIAILVPAVAWAVLHKSALSGYLSLSAIGNFFSNLQPPVHGGADLPTPLVTKLVFDIPAAILVVVGILALVAVFRQRNRVTVGLFVAGISSGSLFGVSNYGSEGIFRVVLFALPWFAILAVMALQDVRFESSRVRLTSAAVLVVLFFANVFGQTGLDWARVVRPDTSAALRQFENTAQDNAVLLVVGTGNAIPSRLTARYASVQYASRDSLNNYPVVTAAYDPAQDLAQLTRALVLEVPAPQHFALVSESTGAWDDRYGMQSYADYLRLEQAIGSSRSWKLVFSGPTTKLYEMTGSQS